MRDATTTELTTLLRRGGQLLAGGWTVREMRAAVDSGALHRVRRGWYIDGAQWRSLWPESQHRTHVIAVNEDAVGERPVFSLTSALVLLGLPFGRARPRRVHVMVDAADRRSCPDVLRHEGALADGDVTVIDGMRCTSLERTVYDIARLAAPEAAIVAADALLARAGGDPRRFDDAAADAVRNRLAERVAVVGVRGIRQARAIVSLADGRAQLPLESETRLQLLRLGFARPRLQTRVPSPHGGNFWMDIELESVNAFYECDGQSKYTDESLRNGRTLERTLLDEKQREDWVRGVTGRRIVRGGSVDVRSPETLAARLTAFAIPLPAHRPHLLLPSRPLSPGM